MLAHLLISDGSYDRGGNTVLVYVNALNRADCVRLANAITAIGVSTTVRVDRVGKNGEPQYKLAIVPNKLPALRAIVVPYMHESMQYRLGM